MFEFLTNLSRVKVGEKTSKGDVKSRLFSFGTQKIDGLAHGPREAYNKVEAVSSSVDLIKNKIRSLPITIGGKKPSKNSDLYEFYYSNLTSRIIENFLLHGHLALHVRTLSGVNRYTHIFSENLIMPNEDKIEYKNQVYMRTRGFEYRKRGGRGERIYFLSTNSFEVNPNQNLSASITGGTLVEVKPLDKIRNEINQILQIHEQSIQNICNASAPRLLVSPKEPLPPESQEDFMSSVNNMSQTASNGWFVVNEPVTSSVPSYSAKDMDFSDLMDKCNVAIWRHFKIPLPIFSQEKQANANLRTSYAVLYDETIDTVFDSWSAFISQVLGLNDYIKYNREEVPSLMNEDLKKTGQNK